MSEPSSVEWASWLEEGARLLAAPSLRRNEVATQGPLDRKFALGDFLCSVPDDFVDSLATALGEDPGTFHSYLDVARKAPPELRVAAAWSVHRDLKEKPELLRPGLTVRQAAILAGKRPIDSKAFHRRTVGERADDVRRLLGDPDVAAVIEVEMGVSRDERRARHQARSFTSEMAAQQKALEAELRDARQAKSPYEATVKATLEMHRAAQLADGVGNMMGDLEQPERLAAALRTLIDSASAALEKYEAPVDQGMVIQGEVWQDRSVAYGLAESAQRYLPPEGRVVVTTRPISAPGSDPG